MKGQFGLSRTGNTDINYETILPHEIETLFNKMGTCELTTLSRDILLKLHDHLYLGWKDSGIGWHSEIFVLCDTNTNACINIPSDEFTGILEQLKCLSSNNEVSYETLNEKICDLPPNELNNLVDISVNNNMVTLSQYNDGKEAFLTLSIPINQIGSLVYAMLDVACKISTSRIITKEQKQFGEIDRHPNHAMIVAKSENMNTVVFGRSHSISLWVECSLLDLIKINGFKFFLCHPFHKDACLHWLNGGASVAKRDDGWISARTSKEWDYRTVYMNPEAEIRISHSNTFDADAGFESSTNS